MKYIMMMHCPRNGYESFGSMTKPEIQAHIGFMHAFNKELMASGEFVAGEGLADPREAKLVKAGKNGAPATDGVFPESKEFLAGYWIVEVANPERAYELAAKASTAPGAGGVPMNMSLEVRQVMSGPPEEFV